jgi:predicted lipoprotein with Yx(FWY)xxD motif
VAAAAVALAVLAAGCGSSGGGSGTGTAGGQVQARSLHGVGTVLVTSKGYALYMFVRDGRKRVTCTGYCASTWPPLKIGAGQRPVAGPGARQSLLGTDPDPAGGRVITYAGWPLYTYASDVQAGQVTGQGVNLNGGLWYLMRPSGVPVKTARS